MVTITDYIPKITTPQILNFLFWGLTTIIILAIIGLITWYFMKHRRYKEYRIEILDKDSNDNVYKIYDRGGVFIDRKTKMRLLWLEKAKVGMNPNNIPYISHKTKKGKIIKTVYLRKIGVNNYVFINVKLGEKVEMTCGEEDLNNAQSELIKIKRVTSKESLLNKLLPYVVWAITIIVIMIILVSLFNKFTILEKVMDTQLVITEKQLEITQLLYNTTTSPKPPIIIGG